MNEHVSDRCSGERDDRKGAVQPRASRHHWLLVCMAVAFTVCSPLPGEALNGEPVGGEGLFRTPSCTSDFAISCDDRPEAGVVSCHMRKPAVGQGLAINLCVDARLVSGGTQASFLEKNITITATDFGEFVCGKEPGGSGLVDFCIVCDTFKDTTSEASHCVKIVHDNPTTPTAAGTCGAYNVSNDNSGVCAVETQDLKQFFNNPRVGFSIGFDGRDAGDKGAGVGQDDGKDLLVCAGRSWQCIEDRSVEVSLGAKQVQQQQTHELINTPCCIKSSSGTPVCNPLWPTSLTCR
jgi:hypothetical protein